MRIGVIGINHKSADLRLREKLAKVCKRRFGPSNSAHGEIFYVLLSTCNRTEIYFNSKNLAETHTYLLDILRCEIHEEFEHRVYSYFGQNCFFHLARVTAGVDSALVGETEIQGQVKQAYETACSYRRLSYELHFLFQKSLKIGKNVRSKATWTRGLPTLEEAILNAGSHRIGDLKKKRILFVGLSEINRKIFSRFKRKGLQKITFCNRSSEKVETIAKKEAIEQISWDQLHRWTTFDLVIFGTTCPHFLVKGDQPIASFSSPKLIIDLSVPRNVDPKIKLLPHLTLLNVDQLNRMIDRKRTLKAAEVARVETEEIAGAVDRQVALFQQKEWARLEGLLSHVS